MQVAMAINTRNAIMTGVCVVLERFVEHCEDEMENGYRLADKLMTRGSASKSEPAHVALPSAGGRRIRWSS
ncbi:hypothetical protein PF006_g30127 [Phytophthora fragariae]|nr:hypothetical protein PF006_g30127 [Phytophthora fragariae]